MRPAISVAFFTFCFTLTLYLVTLPPDLTWAHYGTDGGDLITASMTWGVPHPPGYPLYVVLGKLFSYLPLGTIAYRFNLFSAVSASLAAMFVALIAHRRFELWASVAAGLSFALAPLVWEQAIITEVYALNLLVIAILLWWIESDRHPFGIGLFWALAVTTHLTSLLLLPLVIWKVWSRPKRRWTIVGAAIGSLGWVLVLVFARSDSPVHWGDATTLIGWWWVISGQIYRSNLFSHPILPRLQQGSLPLLQQFSYIGWLPIIWASHRPKNIPYTLTIFLYTIYTLGYDPIDASVNALPAILLCTVLLISGIEQLPRAILLLPILAVALNLARVNLHDDTMIRPMVSDLWKKIPQNAIVLTPGDQTIFTLWYYHHVEKQREDVTLIDTNLFAFDWYRQQLKKQHPALEHLAEDDLAGFHEKNRPNFPICSASLSYIEGISCEEP